MTPVERLPSSDYALSGWRFRSAIRIEGLPVWDGHPGQPVDVALVQGAVPEVECNDPVGVVARNDLTATVVFADVGRFAVRNGTNVVADIRDEALPGVVETAIVGPVLGTLCYQRGIRSLHSNTIVIDGKAVALSGRSGAGKSTLAAILMKRGHRLISDDVLPLAVEPGRTLALPASQNLRLWSETLDSLGEDKSALRRASDGNRDKYFLPSTEKTSRAWPLAALLWLERVPVERSWLERHTRVLRTRTIYKAAYRQHLAREFAAMGSRETSDLSLPGVEVFNFFRPRDLSLLEEQATMIEKLIADSQRRGRDPAPEPRSIRR